jgi:hypothetical protein
MSSLILSPADLAMVSSFVSVLPILDWKRFFYFLTLFKVKF